MAVFTWFRSTFAGGLGRCSAHVFTSITCDIKAEALVPRGYSTDSSPCILKLVFLLRVTTPHITISVSWKDLKGPTITPTPRPQTLTSTQALKAPYVAASLSDQEIMNDFRC